LNRKVLETLFEQARFKAARANKEDRDVDLELIIKAIRDDYRS